MPMFEQLEIRTNFMAAIMNDDVIALDAKVLKVGVFSGRFPGPSPNSVQISALYVFFSG